MSVENLYRQVILEHYRNPRHRGSLEDADAHAAGLNPLCGDEIGVDLRLSDGIIADVAIQGTGCAISQASASMMADSIIGKTMDQVAGLAHDVKVLLDIEEGDEPDERAMGDLLALSGVRNYPVRIKCADLAWTTLTEALGDQG